MWRLLFLGVVPAASEGLTIGRHGLHTHSNNELFAVSPDGDTHWVFNADDYLRAHAEGVDESLYTVYASTASTLFSLQAADGSIMWKHDIGPGQVNGLSVASKDGTVYVASHDDSGTNTTIHAITPAGEEKWTFTCACCDLSDVGSDGTLFIGVTPSCRAPQHSAIALQPDTGAVKWSVDRDPNHAYSSELSVSGPHVFLVVEGYNESVVSSLNLEDGKFLWSYPFSRCHYTSPGHTPMPEVVPNRVTVGRDELYVSGIAHPFMPCSYGVFAFNGTFLRSLSCQCESHLEALPCDSDSAKYNYEEDVFVSYGTTLSKSHTSVMAFTVTDGSMKWSVSEPHFAAPSEPRISFSPIRRHYTTFVSQFDEASADATRSSQTFAIRNAEVSWKVHTGGVSEPVMDLDGTTYVDGWHCEGILCVVEVVAVGVDGVEKWRLRPSKGSAEEKTEATEIAV